jgi:hypothetical protein
MASAAKIKRKLDVLEAVVTKEADLGKTISPLSFDTTRSKENYPYDSSIVARTRCHRNVFSE